MPWINGWFYMNPAYGRALEKARMAEERDDWSEELPEPVELPVRDEDFSEDFWDDPPSGGTQQQEDSNARWVTIDHRHVPIHEEQNPNRAGERGQMSLSAPGLEFIKAHEGFRSRVYLDSAGNPTIGHGHVIQAGENFDTGITREQADALLTQDVKVAVASVNDNLRSSISQTQFDALVSFTYNVGGKNLRKSALLENLNSGKRATEANFTDYNRSGGKVVPGLTARRTDEYNLFSRGVYGGP